MNSFKLLIAVILIVCLVVPAQGILRKPKSFSNNFFRCRGGATPQRPARVLGGIVKATPKEMAVAGVICVSTGLLLFTRATPGEVLYFTAAIIAAIEIRDGFKAIGDGLKVIGDGIGDGLKTHSDRIKTAGEAIGAGIGGHGKGFESLVSEDKRIHIKDNVMK